MKYVPAKKIVTNFCTFSTTRLNGFPETRLEATNKGKKGKGRSSSSWEPHLRATGRHLPYGITQCYLPPDTSERAPPNSSHAGWYSIYLPRTFKTSRFSSAFIKCAGADDHLPVARYCQCLIDMDRQAGAVVRDSC